MSNGQDGDVLVRALLGFEIEVLAGIVQMDGGFETAAQLSLFGGNFDDDGQTDNAEEYWGNLTETEEAFKYRSRTQHILQFLPATTANLPIVERAAQEDLAWFLSTGTASSVTVVATIPGKNRLNLAVDIFAEGEQSSFSFTSNWFAAQAAAQDLAFTDAAQLPTVGDLPPGPETLPGLVLWLDAADNTTVDVTTPPPESPGSPTVDEWRDKSPRADVFQPYDVLAPMEHGNEFAELNGQKLVVVPNVVDTALIGAATETLISEAGYSMFALITESSDDEGQIVGKGSEQPGTTEYAMVPDRLTSEHAFVLDPLASTKALEITDLNQEMESPTDNLQFSSAWTISVWWKPTDTNDAPIFNIGNGSTGGFNYIHLVYQGGATNQYKVKISSNSSSTRNKDYHYTGGPAVPGVWINLTFQYDHGTQILALFQDGAPVVPTKVIDDLALFMNDTPTRIAGYNVQSQGAVFGLGTVYSVALWPEVLSAAAIVEIYNNGNGVNAILSDDFGDYTSSGNLRHWWRPGFEAAPDIGKDFGSHPDHMVSVGGTGIDDADVVVDFPNTGSGFSNVEFGATGLTAKILTAIVDGSSAEAVATAYRNGVQTEFTPGFIAAKPNPNPPDSPSPPNAVGGQFNGLATTITRRFVGSIGEVVVFDRVLSPEEQALIENYLSVKWGVPLA